MNHALPSPTDQLRALPDEAFTRLQYLAPAAGCFNRCAFCSQAAGRDVWQLTRPGLYTLMNAMATVADERGIAIARGRDAHRPGTIFPYLDNDIASYPHLDDYLSLARDTLKTKVRISTVGFSANAPDLTAMHTRIATTLADVLDGVRLSITPYTTGWIDHNADSTSRAQFTADVANILRTYRPVFDRLGHGAATAAVELRFAPLLGRVPVTDTHIDGHHVIAAGPHTLIAVEPTTEPAPTTRVTGLGPDNQPEFTTPPRRYVHITARDTTPNPATVRAALRDTLTHPHHRREVDLYRFRNADGPYYAIEPNFPTGGGFTALHIYPATNRRETSGYTDATRPFLNAILTVKAARGLARRDAFPDATWTDVDNVLRVLTDRATALDTIDPTAATHIRTAILPVVTTYITAMRTADMPPSAVLSREFTIDTGQIVNQGRARGLFRGLVTVADEPMTPREERGYGEVSLSSIRGTVWRIAPVPFANERLTTAVKGDKNTAARTPTIVIEELDPRHLRNTDRATGKPLRRYFLTGVDIERVTLEQGHIRRSFPGITQ
ncbi:hypothetical protein [Embleya scabrispora]|uniref:hypothetical protein n=1 Tax=Embleya scabrispora TaxID=159449 RepID=UPI0003817BD7|nr:hypothetical protein [Embleya scabrispora]MYS81038.1 hypothetical protein [Streptomyces sp. SID5474]